MSIPQQKFRELVFQLLFCSELSEASQKEIEFLMSKELLVSRKNVRLAQEKVKQISDKIPELDQEIARISTSYAINRIPNVELNILRLGIYELFYDTEIPPKVAIAEALRLTRKFSTPEAAHFVNALLDHLYKRSQGFEGNSEEIKKSLQELRAIENTIQKAIDEGIEPVKTTEDDE